VTYRARGDPVPRRRGRNHPGRPNWADAMLRRNIVERTTFARGATSPPRDGL
jgi:hypothetical protein